MAIETRGTMVPVSEWGEGVGVALSTVARRWGVTEAETRELFAFIPTIGDDDEMTFLVAETGQALWESQYILFAESDFPDLAKGRGREVLVAMRALSAVVEKADPGMFTELLHETGMARESLSVDRLTDLAGLEPSGLRAEFVRLRAALDERLELHRAKRNASTAATA